MTRIALALTILASCTAASCDGSRKNGVPAPPPPAPSVAQMSLNGKPVALASVITTEKLRRHALSRLAAVGDGQGHLLAWPRERFMKLESHDALASFDAVFMDRSGKVVDVQALPQGNAEGIMPRAEAAGVLLLAPGAAQRLGVKPGDAAALPAEAANAEDLRIVKVAGIPAHVELALTESERQHGLMFRPRLSAEDGMLFAYTYESTRSFWMGNTLLPLDIAFFSADGTLLNVNETPAYPNPRHPPSPYPTSDSAGPAQFVLEMNLGWFRKKGLVDASGKVAPGAKAEFPPEVRRGSFD